MQILYKINEFIVKKSIMNFANMLYVCGVRIFTTDDDRENRVFCCVFFYSLIILLSLPPSLRCDGNRHKSAHDNSPPKTQTTVNWPSFHSHCVRIKPKPETYFLILERNHIYIYFGSVHVFFIQKLSFICILHQIDSKTAVQN